VVFSVALNFFWFQCCIRRLDTTVLFYHYVGFTQTILTRDLVDKNTLVDAIPDKLRGEILDPQHAAAFLPRTRLVSDTDMAITRGSDTIVTAGARQIPGETQLNQLQGNVALFQKIVPPLAQHSPMCCCSLCQTPVRTRNKQEPEAPTQNWANWMIRFGKLNCPVLSGPTAVRGAAGLQRSLSSDQAMSGR
jgi:hypothetical protein